MKVRYLLVLFILFGTLIPHAGNDVVVAVAPPVVSTSQDGSITLMLQVNQTSVKFGESIHFTVILSTSEAVSYPTQLKVYINNNLLKEIDISSMSRGVSLQYDFNFNPNAPGYYVITVTLEKQAGVVW